jgi:hypothetical protein
MSAAVSLVLCAAAAGSLRAKRRRTARPTTSQTREPIHPASPEITDGWPVGGRNGRTLEPSDEE